MWKRHEILYTVKYGLANSTDTEQKRKQLADSLNERITIFCVTAGRSGSDTLSRIWACVPDVDARHEPRPYLQRVMRKAQSDPMWAWNFLRWDKLPDIQKSKAPIYVETSHLFCKGFIEPALEFGLKPSFVILKRDSRSVARSFLRLGDVPGRAKVAMRYCLYPEDNAILKLSNWENYSDYQLCYWYAQEIHQRQIYYERALAEQGLKTFTIQTTELNEMDRVMEMIDFLTEGRVAVTPDHLSNVVGNSYNKVPAKPLTDQNIDFAAEESVVNANVTIVPW